MTAGEKLMNPCQGQLIPPAALDTRLTFLVFKMQRETPKLHYVSRRDARVTSVTVSERLMLPVSCHEHDSPPPEPDAPAAHSLTPTWLFVSPECSAERPRSYVA